MDQPGTRIQWGQALLVLSMIVLSWWTATQWTAWELAFQPELGRPWFMVLHRWPVYAPPLFFWWWYEFDAYAPAVFARGAWIAGSGGVLAFAAAVALSVHRAREAKRAATYGSARWAEDAEIRAAGLLGEDGVVLGKYRRAYLRHDGPEHVLTFAPTRTGKGVGMVIPTLLTWPGSAIIHDIKGENWQITAGFRNRFGRVLLFDPTNPASSAYNPLLEVRRGASEVRDVQNIADILVDPEGSLERRNHWEKTSHALLVGAILHVLYAEDDKTLAGVAKFLSDPKRSIEATLSAMMRTSHLGKTGPHPVVASAARELLNKSDNERSGVLSTAMSFLGLYRDPVVATVTSRCEWRIGDLLEGDQPVSLYFVIPPSDISRTKPLIRLILNQIGRRLTEDLSGRAGRRRLLLMLDEFPALGRLDFFESALAFMAGYGIKAFLIAQSLNQIDKAYGQNNSILDNCHVRVSFATNDERTAKRVSDGLGVATEIRSQKNYAGHRLSPWLGHLMVSRQESARPLMTVGEVMQLPARDEVVMVAGCPPVRARKARYFRDRRFVERVMPPPDPAQLARPVRPDDWSGRPSPATPSPEKMSPAAPDKPDDTDSDESLGTGRKPMDPHQRVERANSAARIQPTRAGYLNAIQVYPFSEGALYQLYAAPGEITDIALQPGEKLVGSGPVAAGDTVRWIIGDTESGAGASKRIHILLKPTRPDLTSNLVINTDRRTYHLELRSDERTYMASVSWDYPQDQIVALRGQDRDADLAVPVATGIDLDALNFRYRIEGDQAPWRPLRVFDDGRQVFIEFPTGIAQGEMPPLWVIGPQGDGQLVNYRVRGNRMIVDRLFAAAELRLGAKHQQVVRIVRTDGSRRS